MNKERIINIPNTITLIRLLLIPVFCFYLIKQEALMAILFFSIIIISDVIDGFVARRLKQETRLGRVLDGIVDAIFVYSALTIMVLQGKMRFLYLILFLIPKLLIFYKKAIISIKAKKIIYKTNYYRRAASFFVLSLIILSLFKKDINAYALSSVIAVYCIFILEYFKSTKFRKLFKHKNK